MIFSIQFPSPQITAPSHIEKHNLFFFFFFLIFIKSVNFIKLKF